MKHVYQDRDDGLSVCKVCGGAEGSLPTCCPGRRMTGFEMDAVYGGTLDFDRGPMDHQPKWWHALEEPRK